MVLTQSASNPLEHARQLLAAGDMNGARALFRQAVRQAPGDARVLLEAGITEAQAGDFAHARRYLEKAARKAPQDANVFYNLGYVELAEERALKARHAFERALKIDPALGEAEAGLAEACYRLGANEDALAHAEKAIELAPHDAESWHIKGLALIALGRRAEGAGALRVCLRANPHHANAKLNLAVVRADVSGPENPARLLDEVAAETGIPDKFLIPAAEAYALAGELDKAEALAEKAATQGQDQAAVLHITAQIKVWQGDFDTAERLARQSLALNPDQGASWSALAKIKRLGEDDGEEVTRVAALDSLDSFQRMAANHALYHVLERRGDHAGAWRALKKANDIQWSLSPFDATRSRLTTSQIMETFTPKFLADHAGEGFDGEGAVFIVGMPRSGTTLTEQILAAYDDVHPGGERETVTQLLRGLKFDKEAIAQFPADWPRQAGKRVHDEMFADAGTRRFATDKLPANYAVLGLLAWILPKARFIYCHREPGDNMLSLYEQNFGHNLKFSANLDSIVEVYRWHRRYMAHWIDVCGLNVHAVNYDHLVRDPEPHARALIDFVGLEWDPKCLNPQTVERPVFTASQWQARQPITAGSVNRWRRFEPWLKPYVDKLEAAQ